MATKRKNKILTNFKVVDGSTISATLKHGKIYVIDRYNSFSSTFPSNLKKQVCERLKDIANRFPNTEINTSRQIFDDGNKYTGSWVRTRRIKDICEVIMQDFEKPSYTSGRLKRMSVDTLMDTYYQIKDNI